MPGDGPLFLTALGFTLAEPLLSRLSPARLDAWLVPRRAPPAPAADRIAQAERCVEAALAFVRPVAGQTCLTRGLTRYAFLARAGADVTLCFGAGFPGGGAFAGHCWLERDGQPFLEAVDPRPLFTKVLVLPPRRLPAARRMEARDAV